MEIFVHEKDFLAAKLGDDLVREKLIRHYKPYVINTVGHICKRYVSWSDEEASIGLLAFNKAIDTYEPDKGRTFLNYGYLLMKRDLIDFFRKEQQLPSVSLNEEDEEATQNRQQVAQSITEFQRAEQTNELVEEILELSEALSRYKISFEELEKFSPKHQDTRQTLIEMAEMFCGNEECLTYFITKKQLPVTLFSKKTGYRLKTIERHRKYIVTLILVTIHPQWTQLHQFINKGGKS
ncbi:RNA polymerase sigma-I factor [Bacillaceae bacterium IKA-2]|nr:RNA polymerase sigma-I factor [Bacillaceae bacterium IKA-2]